MDIKSLKFWLILAITFVILFLMNYIGNEESDRLYRALLVASVGSVCLGIGLKFFYKNDAGKHQDFD
ncbi:MAG: hypothetical protein LBE36_13890 [Flavobacteriaceae bacterium]|jgi:amino acid transporter|nr:hypothetical protein [Flavobacteriaceae bacterium]